VLTQSNDDTRNEGNQDVTQPQGQPQAQPRIPQEQPLPAQEQVHRWGVFEAVLQEDGRDNVRDPLRDLVVSGEFVGPAGQRRRSPSFWDGGTTWRVRFSPDDVGEWRYTLRVDGGPGASDAGRFTCVPYEGDNPLYRHGPVRVSGNRRHLAHADGTPFFFLDDTVWNGPMRAATAADWHHYVAARREQGFTAAMFVSTSWKGLPDGGPDGPSHRGAPDSVEAINPRFYQRLDRSLDALVEGALIGAPVLLWANGSATDASGNRSVNPGVGLPEEDAILLARYQVARWHAYPVVWILNGDGRYTGEHAARWKRIGRAVFGDNEDGVPVALHCSGIQWPGDDFKDEPWVDILGYQSSHRGTATVWRWLAGLAGPIDSAGNATGHENASPARGWHAAPGKIAINLEPCYEHHNLMDPVRAAAAGGTSGATLRRDFQRFSAEDVRRAIYWSLLVTPTAGVAYGGSGVWGWDPGGQPPIAHPLTGDTPPWREALNLEGAHQLRHLRAAFESVAWWTLVPDTLLVVNQAHRATASDTDVLRTTLAARSDDGSLAVAYLPAGAGPLSLDRSRLSGQMRATWFDPRTGATHAVDAHDSMAPPDATADWLLVLQASRAGTHAV